MKIQAQCEKFDVVSWMYETRGVAEFATDSPRKKIICFFIYSCVFVFVVVILTKKQNIIAFRIK